MMLKLTNFIISGLLILSLMSSFSISKPSDEPSVHTAVFNSVCQTPEYPFGFEWDTGDGEQVYNYGWGGDVITVYADVVLDPQEKLYIKYGYCNNIACYDGESGGWDDMDFRGNYSMGWEMNYISGTLYNYTLIGDWMWGFPTYPAADDSDIKVEYWVYSSNTTSGDEVLGAYRLMYPYWPASQINVTSAVSETSVFPGTTLWVNGSANYYHRLNWHDNPPAIESDVTVSVNPVYQGKTNATGDFSIQFPAPTTPGPYTINTTVTNSTPNRDATCVSDDLPFNVVPFPVVDEISIGLSDVSIYPGKPVWVNGTGKYDIGDPVETSKAYVNLTGDPHTLSTDSNGDYTQQISAPMTPGDHTITVTLIDEVYDNSKNSTTTILTVQTPTMDVIANPNTTTPYPNHKIWVNGTATYGNGEPATLADVNVSISGTFLYNDTVKTGLDGSYNICVNTPDSSGIYIINVTVNSPEFGGVIGYNDVGIFVTEVPIPDLQVGNDDIALNETAGLYLEGHTIIITVNISNIGNKVATDVLVDFTSYSSDEIYLGSENITALNDGEYTLIAFNWTAVPGNHMINVTIDPLNITEEAFEDNNRGSKGLFIDGDPDGDDIGNLLDDDDDNDGYNDTVEIAEGSDPLDNSSVPDDIDGDLIPDSMDDDIDGDGYNNTVDRFPLNVNEWNDTDGNGIGDNTDPDIDGDGVDNDGDDFPYDETEWADFDGDGIGDNTDLDFDGDGYDNDVDVFPIDPNEWADFDGDGIGDVADDDDDADGYEDATEDPLLGDTDNDGLPNNLDLDDDSDGIQDSEDQLPLDTDNDVLTNQEDADDDGDGIPDRDEDLNWNGLVDHGETDYLNPDTDGDGVNDLEDIDPLDPAVSVAEVESGNTLIIVILVIIICAILALLLFIRMKFA